MSWQDWAVAVIAVAVVIALMIRVWRFFRCKDESGCSSCNKECELRKLKR